jgi:hypothetical protein
VKVSVVRGGGLAGLVTSTELDSADLATAEADALRTAVDRARSAHVPPPPGPGMPDRFGYEVRVEDDAGTETLRAREPVPDPMRELIIFVQESPARKRRTGPPGAG